MREQDCPLVHFYPQYGPHADVQIMGNRLGLARLAAIIRETLDGAIGPAATENLCCIDGEGFTLHIILETEATAQRRYPLPYTATESP